MLILLITMSEPSIEDNIANNVTLIAVCNMCGTEAVTILYMHADSGHSHMAPHSLHC